MLINERIKVAFINKTTRLIDSYISGFKNDDKAVYRHHIPVMVLLIIVLRGLNYLTIVKLRLVSTMSDDDAETQKSF